MSPRYILRALGRSGLLDVVSLSAPELEGSYQEMITEQKRLYSQVQVTSLHWPPDLVRPRPNRKVLEQKSWF